MQLLDVGLNFFLTAGETWAPVFPLFYRSRPACGQRSWQKRRWAWRTSPQTLRARGRLLKWLRTESWVSRRPRAGFGRIGWQKCFFHPEDSFLQTHSITENSFLCQTLLQKEWIFSLVLSTLAVNLFYFIYFFLFQRVKDERFEGKIHYWKWVNRKWIKNKLKDKISFFSKITLKALFFKMKLLFLWPSSYQYNSFKNQNKKIRSHKSPLAAVTHAWFGTITVAGVFWHPLCSPATWVQY